MAEQVGKEFFLSFKGTQINCNSRNFTSNIEIGLADATTACDTARVYEQTMEDGSADATFLMQSAATGSTTVPILCNPGEEGSLIWGPDGNATGEPRRTVNAIVKSYSESFPYDDVQEISVSWQFSGAVTFDTF